MSNTNQIGQSLQQIRQFRVDKLSKLRELGFDPYPARVRRDRSNLNLKEQFDDLQGQIVSVVGRVNSIRSYGKLSFYDIKDESGNIQVIIMPQFVESVDKLCFTFEQAKEFIDNGDFIEAIGELIKSKTGEISIQVKNIRIITKSLRPIPEKLEDVEERQRKRYLDILVNSEMKARFERRSRYWQAHRDFFRDHGFIELSMPILEHTTGGADANPFVTHMDAIDQNFYLRISHELPLKRMIGAGFEKVYEIGTRFRNEGFSDEHLPEHVAMEFYWAYADYKEGMRFVEEMFKYTTEKTWGTTKINWQGHVIDFEKKWEVLDFSTGIKDRFDVDIFNTNLEEVTTKLKESGYNEKIENLNRGIDQLGKLIRKTIVQPTWMINEPLFLSPLAKKSLDNPLLCERVHPWMMGSELGNGFSELNDALDQLERFELQQSLRNAGDNEAQMLDLDYVEMLEYGMPPAFGWGHAERNFWAIEGVSAREGVIFPPMKAINHVSKEVEIKVAHIIIDDSLGLLPWQISNTVANLMGSLANRSKMNSLFTQDITTTSDLDTFKLNPNFATIIKKSNSRLNDLRKDLKSNNNIQYYEFTREMIETTNDKKIIKSISSKKSEEVEILGIIIFGIRSEVEEVTKNLEKY